MSDSSRHEAVAFFGNSGISNEMLYSEFESLLDGMIPTPDLANTNIQAAFLNVNGSLLITSIVFFTISFDDQGFADGSWNVPLRSLAGRGVDGPDLGAGPIKIYMQSADDGGYQDLLWDPSERGGTNDLIHLRDAIRNNRLCLTKSDDESDWGAEEVAAPAAAPQQNSSPMQAAMQALPSEQNNVSAATSTLMNESNDEFSQAIKIIESQRIRITALENALQKAQDADLEGELVLVKEHLQQQQQESSQQIDELNQNLAGLQADLGETTSKLKEKEKAFADAEKALKASEAKVEKIEKQAKAKIDELKKKYEKSQSDSQASLEKDLKEEAKKEIEALEKDFNEKLAEEKEIQKSKDQQLENFKKELTTLRGDRFRLVKDGAESFFKKIEDADISFMAFRPGVGHLTIPSDEIGIYMEAPNEYCAKKCDMTLEEYETWLEHYNNPVCVAPLPGDKICGDKVTRTDSPNAFKKGFSDRCNKHGGR